MFKTDKVVFKKLNKMPITKRIEVASSPQGSSVLAALTPTEFAELFPRYYQRGLPDVGGFRAATTAAAQKRQSEASASILDRLTRAEQGAEAYASQIYHKIKRKLGLETEKQPELSPEQAAAFDKVRSGPIAVSSDEGKVFSRLDDKKLESVGITRTKDNTGRDVYQYTQPEVGVEEAKARFKGGKPGSAPGAYNPAIEDLKKEIARGEGDYGAYNRGRAGDTPKGSRTIDITQLTVGEVLQRQQGPNRSFMAVGKYQFIPDTLKAAVKWSKVDLNAKFDANTQEKLFGYLISEEKRPILNAYLTGKSKDVNGALDDLASEFASIPGPNGKGKYEGLAGNAAMGGAARAEKIKQLLSSAQSSGGLTQTKVEEPKGPNGQYTDEQINKMMDLIREEKNTSRKQVLATLLSDAGVDTATINSISQVKTSGITGEHFGKGKECVALSKHFAPALGPASEWKFHQGTSGIVPGAVIATTSYGHGPTPGGARFDQMPDRKSHYHTGIALTRPNAAGDVLIFDQARGHGSKITKININDYNGEKWGAVVGGEPTNQSMEAVNIALSRANSSEKAAIMESTRGETPKGSTSTGEIKAVTDVGPPPSKPVDQEGNPIPPQAQAPVKQPGEPQEPAPQVKADAPPPAPKIQPVKYKFNEQAFLKEVRAKSFGAGLVSDEYIMGETLKGFKETAGVKYDRKTGTITIEDPNSPAIQKVISEMRANNLDEKVFLNKMKEEKPTPPPETKPKEQKPVAPPPEKKAETPSQSPAPQAQATPQARPPEKKAETPQTPAPTPPTSAPPPPEPPKVEAKPQEPPKVPGASDGGLFNVGDRNVAISPMDKRDDKAVIDTKTQQPLFTVKSGEKINVTPQQKVDGIAPAQDNIRNEINALRQEMGNSFADAGGRMSPVQMTQIRSAATDNPNFVNNLTKQNVDLWNNPVMERAMNRTRLQETGDSLNNHFSYGNTNG